MVGIERIRPSGGILRVGERGICAAYYTWRQGTTSTRDDHDGGNQIPAYHFA